MKLNTWAVQRNRSAIEQYMETGRASQITVVVLTVLAFIVRFAKLNHPDQVVYVLVSRLRRVRTTKSLAIASTRSILASLPPTTCVANTTSTFTPHLRSCCSLLRDGLLVLRATSTSRALVTATRPTTSHTGECVPCRRCLVVSRFLLYTPS